MSTARAKSGGVLPINAAATKKNELNQSTKSNTRAPAPRLRLIIRRLPPGLTETEFWSVLGDEWRVGKGKLDWAAYKEGKVSRDPAKPSRPSRAYLRVKDQVILDDLSSKVKITVFQDAKNTSKDSCLLGPPSLEFAPYNKMPGSRVRHDGRQGTIDQDQEFIDFLQSLTEPIVKPAVNGIDSAEAKPEKVTTTPLVQYLKEKKANKAKESSQSKSSKGGKEPKASKGESKATVIVKGSSSSTEKAKLAKATQEAVKAANKSAATVQGKQNQSKGETKATTATATSSSTAASKTTKESADKPSPAKRERERGNISAAARILQRDLGLAPKPPRGSRVTSATQSAAVSSPNTTTGNTNAVGAIADQPKVEKVGPEKPAAQPTEEKKPAPTPAQAQAPPTGPRNSRSQNNSSNTSTTAKTTSTPAQRPPKAPPQPSSGAKSAFLKHANPSQGVTEDLLRSTFETFGKIIKCEIDKKKGLGYIDFEDTESLRKAMQASPVKVGNGQVVVLENRNQQARRGGGGGGGGGGSATATSSAKASPAPAAAVLASNTSSAVPSTVTSPVPAAAVPAAPPSIASNSSATTAPVAGNPPPSAPRGGGRGGGRGGSGGNRGGSGANKGGPAGGEGGGRNRNVSRGGFKGGRGGSGGRRGGAASGQPATAASAAGEGNVGSNAAPAAVPASKAAGEGK